MVQIMRGQIPLEAAMTDVANSQGKSGVNEHPKLSMPLNEAEAKKSSMTMNTGKVLNLNFDKIMSSLAEFMIKVKDAMREYSTLSSHVDYGNRRRWIDAKNFLAMHKVCWKK
jgi:hypothetical protein